MFSAEAMVDEIGEQFGLNYSTKRREMSGKAGRIAGSPKKPGYARRGYGTGGVDRIKRASDTGMNRCAWNPDQKECRRKCVLNARRY